MRNSDSFSRRRFIETMGLAAASAALPGLLFAKTGGSGRMVVVVLRGALDGLAAAPPYGDPDYGHLRGDLALAAPGTPAGVRALDSTFGLHPSLVFLHERYRDGELAVIHAVASPYRDRSHFDGQNVLENGLTQPVGAADGWLNRALSSLPSASGGHPDRAVAVSQNVPLILRGQHPVLSKSPATEPEADADLLERLADLYSKDAWFSARLSEAVQSDRMTADGGSPMTPQGAKPTADRIGSVARMAAALMRTDGGPEVAVIEATGWDTHANQGAANGILAQRLGSLDSALRQLADGLGPLWEQTAVVVVTEFGRTAAINGTRGTDHGTGGVALLLGGAVHGGRVITDWPGLGRSALLDGRDLRPTTDLRSLFKAVLGDHMLVDNASMTSHVFPNSSGARPLQGLIRA